MASLKSAISLHCKNCSYDPKCTGTWREQVEMCTVKSCALWEVRPVTTATVQQNRKPRGKNLDINLTEELLDDNESEFVYQE